MKREIKFRAWDPQTKKFDDRPIIRDGKFLEVSYGELLGTVPEIILEQYTGLKDKNGKEIYEGDILKHCKPFYLHNEKQTFTVIWQDVVEKETDGSLWMSEKPGFRLKRNENGLTTCFVQADLEIIGNIHEDREP